MIVNLTNKSPLLYGMANSDFLAVPDHSPPKIIGNHHNYITEVESRAQFCRDQMVAALKNALALERKKSGKVIYEYGRIKERYDNLVLKKK